jgi:hypothetical protein
MNHTFNPGTDYTKPLTKPTSSQQRLSIQRSAEQMRDIWTTVAQQLGDSSAEPRCTGQSSQIDVTKYGLRENDTVVSPDSKADIVKASGHNSDLHLNHVTKDHKPPHSEPENQLTIYDDLF